MKKADYEIGHLSKAHNEFEFRKERTIGQRGCGSKWPILVVQLVIEKLINSTPPSSIKCNIAFFVALTKPSHKIKVLPGLNCIRECRATIQIIGETLTVYRLTNAENWEQVFTDGTSRRQIALQIQLLGY